MSLFLSRRRFLAAAAGAFSWAPRTRLRVVAASEISRSSPTWGSLPPHAQQLVTATLPPAGGPWSATDAASYIRDAGIRGAAYSAAGLLLRAAPNDAARANVMIDEIIRWQRIRPGNKHHGVWPESPRRPRLDPNWREFVSLGLIAIRERFTPQLNAGLAARLDAALIRAAEGSAKRNVPISYTNVALMSTFLLSYAGLKLNRPDFAAAAAKKRSEFDDAFQTGRSIAEFNSPTYLGVDLLIAAMSREFLPGAALNAWANRLEERFWRDAADFYHPGLRNLCGPYSRAYGMDMTRYVALAGLAISLAAPAESPPLPDPLPAANHELAYASLFALAPPKVNADIRNQLETFTAPRRIERTIEMPSGTHSVAALLESNWMMGAGGAMRGPRNQACPATIHWRAGGDIGWLCVVGDERVIPQLVDRRLEIAIGSPRPTSIRIWLAAPRLPLEAVAGPDWKLPGLNLRIESALTIPPARWIETPRFGRAIEVAWKVPSSPAADPLVVLSPRPV